MNAIDRFLSRAEWAIMNICWKKGKSSARDIYEESLKEKKRSYHTIKTMLDRLVIKGFLAREKFGPIWLYSPAVARMKIISGEIETFVSTVLDNTFTPLLSFLAGKQKLTEDEIEELEKLIREKKKGDKIMNSLNILDHLFRNLWAASWQVSFLILIIWVISLITRKRSIEFRSWLWMIVLVRLCLPIGISLPSPLPVSVQNYLPDQSFLPFEKLTGSEKISQLSEDNSDMKSTLLNTKNSTSGQKKKSLLSSLLILFWFTGTFIILAGILWRSSKLHNQLKKCSPVLREDLLILIQNLSKKIHITQKVGIFYLDLPGLTSPAVAGIFRPRIYLPRSMADSWTPEDLEPVFLHELFHIRRYDAVINWLQIVVQAIYFFHPLVWLANWKIRNLREEVCDDLAINHLNRDREKYAKSILSAVKKSLHEPVWGFVGLGFIERKKSLNARINRIMDSRYLYYKKAGVVSILGLAIVAVIVIILSCTRTPSDELKSIIAKAESYDNMIKSGSGSYIWENVDDVKRWTIQKTRVEFAFDGNKIDRQATNLTEVTNHDLTTFDFIYQRYTFDGKKAYQLAWANNKNGESFVKEAFISSEPYNPMPTGNQYMNDPRFFGMTLQGTPIGEYLKMLSKGYSQEYKIKNLNLLGRETINGIRCIKIGYEILYGKNSNQTSKTILFLSPDMMYRIVKTDSDNKATSYMKYRNFGKNLWFIKDIQLFTKIKGTEKSLLHVTFNDDWKINTPLPDSLFTISFPKGTKVYDTTAKN